MKIAVRTLAVLLTTLVALLTLLAGSASAVNPVVTYTSPSVGHLFTDNTITITGTYRSNERVSSVEVVICRPNSPTECGAYITGDSTFTPVWTNLPAHLTPSDASGKSGSFSFRLTGVPVGGYRASTYAVDATTSKGPRAIVDFQMDGVPYATPGYISILFGRASWQAAAGEGCTIRPDGARTLEQNAADLAARGLFGVAEVVVRRTDAAARRCWSNFTTQASWADLGMLRDRYGWSIASQGMSYADMTQMTTFQERFDESAATLPIFEEWGHTRAWGSFAYASDRMDPAAEAVVSKYFGFGRDYGAVINNRQTATTYPYRMVTLSVNGGRCHNPKLSCYKLDVTNGRRSTRVDAISQQLRPGSNQWGVVQFYRTVEGSFGRLGDAFAWDCTDPYWQNRWTSQPELYCRNSFLEAIDGRSASATVVDPVTVAQKWFRIPTGGGVD